MITSSYIKERITQLQNERQQLTAHIERLQAELAHATRMIHGYDGAIGELTLLAENDEGEPSDDGGEEQA